MQFFTDTDVHCSAADNWKTPQWKTSAWNIGAHCKTILQMMAAPLPLVPIMRTSAVNEQHKKCWCEPELSRHNIRCNTSCRVPFSASCPSHFSSKRKKRKTKQNQKLWKSAFLRGRRLHSSSGLATNMNFPHVEEYVLLCEARGLRKQTQATEFRTKRR